MSSTPEPQTPLDEATVHRMAELARLDIGDEEARELGRQFASILKAFQVLSQLDLEGQIDDSTEPMVGASGMVNVLRDDVAVPCLPPEKLLAAAPARVDDFYRVPKTVGGAE
jgi:aspartyl-tRNA(Asn)/glutamyl-tRNA(Gln) amidotransferase subunit C